MSNRSKTAEYRIWAAMIRRCTVEKDEAYPRYGGRGITVCDRWRESFEAFLADMGERPSDEHSIDRRNNDGNYEPLNCRWATKEEQANNTSVNHRITFGERTATLTQWAREQGIDESLLRWRIENWGLDKAMRGERADRQVRGAAHKLSKLTADQVLDIYRRRLAGERGSVLAKEYGVTHTLVTRIMRGTAWSHVTGVTRERTAA